MHYCLYSLDLNFKAALSNLSSHMKVHHLDLWNIYLATVDTSLLSTITSLTSTIPYVRSAYFSFLYALLKAAAVNRSDTLCP